LVFVCCKECATKALDDLDKTLAAVEKLRVHFGEEYDVSGMVVAINAQETVGDAGPPEHPRTRTRGTG
jgi:hypothetical protein